MLLGELYRFSFRTNGYGDVAIDPLLVVCVLTAGRSVKILTQAETIRLTH
jgi:hypothetical protein